MTELSQWAAVPTLGEVMAALPEIVLQVDADFRLRTLNRLDSPLFRRPPEAGDRLEQVFDGRVVSVVAGVIDTAQRTGGADRELDTGTEIYWVTGRRLSAAPMTLLVFQEITGLRHAEQALVDVVRDRSSFLASISHELRTPLTAVLGYARLLSEPRSDLDEEARNAMVQDMTDQAWDLAGIVEDLLAVARTEIGDLRLVSVPVNLMANASQVIESMGDRGSRVSLQGDRSISGMGDPARFRQIVRNLLSNALTHGAEPVSIEVDADGAHARLRVRDGGPGVPASLIDSIFDQYVTAGADKEPGRVGIGLWISRELTSLMGGHIVYLREGEETVFQVSIPLRPGEEAG